MAVKKPVIIVLRPLKAGESQLKTESLTNFEGKKIGQVRGTHYNEEYEKNDNINKIYVDEYKQGLKMLAKGRVDGFIGAKEAIDENYSIKDPSLSYPKTEGVRRLNL